MKSIFATFAAWALFGASLIDGTRVIAVNGGGYFPVLIRLHDGKLMAVLRGGAPHIGVKGRLDVITSTDDGKTWSAPRTAIDGPEDDGQFMSSRGKQALNANSGQTIKQHGVDRMITEEPVNL